MKTKSPLGFRMPHSPLNQNDSIAASKAWNKFKSGYMNRTHKFKGRKNERPLTAEENLAEYNREKNEFYYDTHKNKMSYIPTDDAEMQDEDFKSKLKKWQLPPLDRRSPLKHVVPSGKGHTHTEDERDYSESTGGVIKKKVLKKEGKPADVPKEKINRGGGVKKAVLKKERDPGEEKINRGGGIKKVVLKK